MSANDFLLINPPEWILAVNPNDMIFAYGETGFADGIVREEWGVLEEVIRAGGYLPAGKTLIDMRMLSIGTEVDRLHLWFKFANVAA